MRKLRQNLVRHVKLGDGPVKITKDDGAKSRAGSSVEAALFI